MNAAGNVPTGASYAGCMWTDCRRRFDLSISNNNIEQSSVGLEIYVRCPIHLWSKCM